MITGIRPAPRLTKQLILDKIGEEAIFSYYLPDLKVGRTVLSPFRKEEDPSFLVTNKGGSWHFRDLADTRYHGDCFDLVCMLFSLSFVEALEKIDQDFGLGFSGEQKDYQRIIRALPKHKERPPAVIEAICRAFTRRELAYWNRHLQSLDDLRKNEVYALDQAFLNGQALPQPKADELAFGYYFPELDRWKLYHPERSQREGKWLGSISGMHVEAREQLIGGTKGIITKSRKDRMVLQKIYPYVCNVQNESNAGFTTEFREFLSEHTTPYLLFDSDTPGRKNSQAVAELYQYEQLILPPTASDKDCAGWVYKDGPYGLTEFLYQQHFI